METGHNLSPLLSGTVTAGMAAHGCHCRSRAESIANDGRLVAVLPVASQRFEHTSLACLFGACPAKAMIAVISGSHEPHRI
jgi:hypothetical protein